MRDGGSAHGGHHKNILEQTKWSEFCCLHTCGLMECAHSAKLLTHPLPNSNLLLTSHLKTQIIKSDVSYHFIQKPYTPTQATVAKIDPWLACQTDVGKSSLFHAFNSYASRFHPTPMLFSTTDTKQWTAEKKMPWTHGSYILVWNRFFKICIDFSKIHLF